MLEITNPSNEELSLLWRCARNEGMVLQVAAFIPEDENTEPIDWDELFMLSEKTGDAVPGYLAIDGPVIGKGSRLLVFDKFDNTLHEDVHPNWIHAVRLTAI